MPDNLTLGPSALLLIRESQLTQFRNIDVGPGARLLVLPDTLPANWAALLAEQIEAGGQGPVTSEDKAPTRPTPPPLP